LVETCTVLAVDVLGVVDEAGGLVELDELLPPQPVAPRPTAVAIRPASKRFIGVLPSPPNTAQ
jgi:hypothetical protein